MESFDDVIAERPRPPVPHIADSMRSSKPPIERPYQLTVQP